MAGVVKRLWLDLGEFDSLNGARGPLEQWQDHGLGLLRTIMHQAGLLTDIASVRACSSWEQVAPMLEGYDTLLMNVRSYNFGFAKVAAAIFKALNPSGKVMVGGMHATVDPEGMAAIKDFDWICQGGGEKVILDLVTDPQRFDRVFAAPATGTMAEWPEIDRRLWPKGDDTWPLEPTCGWGPPPVATLVTSRVCPWRCAFCNEASYIPNMERRPVEMIIEELNRLDREYGPLGSVVIHDSMFFQHPAWLREWLEKYPKLANRTWPYWAAGRADTVRRWPDLFEALVRETNWNVVSIGFESGSDRVLKILNKECTVEDNRFCIELLNRIGDEMEAEWTPRPRFWANIMFATPGETREDAFDTVRMIHTMKDPMVVCAFYSPYPGSALGYQLIAEGKSLLRNDAHDRFPGPKVAGVDYQFYSELVNNKYDQEIFSKTW